jgi:hypothetical protein
MISKYERLRNMIAEARDSYGPNTAAKRALFTYLMTHTYDTREMHVKLGGRNVAWLHGLVEYGKSHGWDQKKGKVRT